MDKQRQEEIIKFMTEKGATEPCPRCKNPQFELIGETSISLEEERKTLLGTFNPKIPVIILACKNCGYITYHAERILIPTTLEKLSRSSR